MSDQEFHAAHQNKSKEELQAMAWRHGYGKGSNHYVDKHKKGKSTVAEGSLEEVSLDLAKRARDKAEYDVDMDYDDMRNKPYGHSEKQRSKFQRYIDKKEPRAKGDRDWDPPKQGVAEARIETIHGSAYTIDPNKYYVWAWDNAVVLYGEYTDENNAELNLSKIERRATKRLGPAVKGRFEVASGKMLLRQYGNEQGMSEGYWADAVKKAEADRKARKGKPFEKNPASHDKDGVYIGDKDLAGNPVPKRTEPGVAEAKADPLGAWIAHKNGTEARKFKTREGAKKYVASHAGFTVSSSEAFHDTYRKKTDKKQGDTMAEDYLDEK